MIRGSCLCGSIRYRTDEVVGPLGHCHCQMCGAAFSSVVAADQTTFRWEEGRELLSTFESSPGKWRWFCSRCGSQLISTRGSAADASPDSVLLRAGCIDSGYETPGVAHCWVESKARWHEITDELPQFERGFPGSPPGVEEP